MTDEVTYQIIGQGYQHTRRADPRWQARLSHYLSGVDSLVNIGAGAGSYEPQTTSVVAVEPSMVMIEQRPAGAAPVVCATAEQLPFPDQSFAVAMAILTTHHWSNVSAGIAEMMRVASSQLFLTWDPVVFARQFWLVRDYLPQVGERELGLATLDAVLAELPHATVEVLTIPADCRDGVMGAYWRRPEAYLQPEVRAAMSGLALSDQATVNAAMLQLDEDLQSGAWHARNAEITDLTELDLGYRLVWARPPS